MTLRVFLVLLFAASISNVGKSEQQFWDFDDGDVEELTGETLVGDAAVAPVGPTAQRYRGLPETNLALKLDGKGDYLRVPDNGPHGSLDFDQGDPITLEAWVMLERISAGQNVYILGKGRTHLGDKRHNQNYALRLRGVGKEACPSFLFRSVGDADADGADADVTDTDSPGADGADGKSDWHRWTTKRGFRCDGLWHHVAITYEFGNPDSIRGYVDGEAVAGKWDMGGPTERRPVVDDDELWIGASMGGSPGTSLAGAIDAVAIRKRIDGPDVFAGRRSVITTPPALPSGGLTEGVVTITIEETDGSNAVWPMVPSTPLVRYEQSALAIARIPPPYGKGGVRRDWRGPARLIATTEIQLPSGVGEWMLRAGGLSRLWVDDTIVAETPAHLGPTSGHGKVVPYPGDDPWVRPIRMGHHQQTAKHAWSGGKAVVALETMIGGKGLRYEPGEIIVAYRRGAGDRWEIVSPDQPIPLTDQAWRDHVAKHDQEIQRVEDQQRKLAASKEDEFWTNRHEHARRFVTELPEIALPEIELPVSEHEGNQGSAQLSAIDRLIVARLEQAGRQDEVTEQTSDEEFLRRLYLDCVGVVPSLDEIDAFAAMKGDCATRRGKVIDRALEDPRWADHWTAYWMDVLAENASMLKPSLNNTGPFRWYLYDMMRDNVAVDRWVTGLIRMRGSELFGGPAGFAMAADNDVPMAAKAHVAVSAFLAVNMKCARCHDAPYHDWTQRDLFSLAAMLQRGAIEVPASSTVPVTFFEDQHEGESLITSSLSPGQAIEPSWPLASYTTRAIILPQHVSVEGDPLTNDSRQLLAYQLTRVENRQFAKTIVNRIWQRMMGEAIVHPVDDWEGAAASHPKLLDYLSRELAGNGYDVKHVIRLILNSDAYQRRSVDRPIERDETLRLFASPRARRMTAEQIVDSMHAVIGRPMDADELTFDPEARMKPTAQNNLGLPRRAWELTSLSNERDRPALTLPSSAAVAECMEAFGWTGSRQEPINHRQTAANVIQPGILANGLLSIQLTRLTDDDQLTQMAIESKSVDELVERLFLRFLTRRPTDKERTQFVQLLSEGFEDRVREFPAVVETPVREPYVSWANHLHPEATEVRLRQSARLRLGPSPSVWLRPQWRERLEDVTWAMINAPEFQFIP